MDNLADIVLTIADSITLYVTLWALLGTGIFLTILTKGIQFRMFRHMWHVAFGSRKNAGKGISSFQAFTISLAARVGVGNVFGVAAALLLGGPGAIFWMWIVAMIGMATSFAESTLAQIFKVKALDGTFRGGPAFYMQLGMKKKWFGVIFSVIAIVTCGFVITSVQSNAIAGTLTGYLDVSPVWTAVILFLFAAPIIFTGIRTVARVTEFLAPLMALVYVVMALVIILMNITAIPAMLWTIIESAFSGASLLSGVGGSFLAAILNGIKRGMFSNEAGQGTAPNAAATATVAHPVHQGLIQALGVFVDTIIVCTATAIIILLAGPSIYAKEGENPATLTTSAVAAHLGQWANTPMAIIIFVLAFSSIIAAYVYSEVNMDFITKAPWGVWAVRVVSVGSIVLGAVLSLPLVWNAVDIAMAVMTVTNLIALVVLSKWVKGALHDYESQRKQGVSVPHFDSRRAQQCLPAALPTDAWDSDAAPQLQ
ncbi:MAG: alanine/glycine:cation symporter family protein [Actinomycetaceae bacterium]|nr:alanine/glycine:cation symporter family protein [Actinomycetaceae bacterium]